MCSRTIWLTLILFTVVSCYSGKKLQKIRSGDTSIHLTVSEEEEIEDEEDECIDVTADNVTGEPFLMNAVLDGDTGEMVASDVIRSSKVVARFRNVPERLGYVSISFDVIVPSEMSDSRWQLKLFPSMQIQSDTVQLDPVFITGKEYRAGQLRGYQRYNNFLSSIITDTTDFIRMGQLEIFLQRYFPETYAMKSDTTIVSDLAAESLFGVSQYEALHHYTKHLKLKINQRRKSRLEMMYDKYITDPIMKTGIRLDTVLVSEGGDFIYRYEHTFRSRPSLKKVNVMLKGKVYERGECIYSLPFPDELTFYISSLSSMADLSPRYRTVILDRAVHDSVYVKIDFRKGSAIVDSSSLRNRMELNRVRQCISDISSDSCLGLDSLVITATCSPEGTYRYNRKLSIARSKSVSELIADYIPESWVRLIRTSCLPENWDMFRTLVAKDDVLEQSDKIRILRLTDNLSDPDAVELSLSRMAKYGYLKDSVYTKLRTVSFDFHLHRIGMHKDTVHTTELDSVYMSGLEALKELDYMRAVAVLKPYADYNAALAYASADCNHSALAILDSIGETDARVCYLKALVLSRLGKYNEALKCFERSVKYDPYMVHRANLDPEMYRIISKRTFN